jgi:hypothetical protein
MAGMELHQLFSTENKLFAIIIAFSVSLRSVMFGLLESVETILSFEVHR